MGKKHWIYIKRGLSEDPKHRAKMGECVWLYMHIIDRVDWETGIAFDWHDAEEATGMSMHLETLRRQRQKLADLNYILCRQKQHSQDIYVLEWRNPRDYGNEVKNPRFEGTHDQLPSEIQDDIQGSNQDAHEQPPSEFQGSNQGSNQVQAQVTTPTSTSESISEREEKKPSPDFSQMTVSEARKWPTIRLYIDATEFFPGSILWGYVDSFITEHQLTLEKIKAAAIEWMVRGYKQSNVKGILEWAAFGIPPAGKSAEPTRPPSQIFRAEEHPDPKRTKPPAELRERVHQTVAEVAAKLSAKANSHV